MGRRAARRFVAVVAGAMLVAGAGVIVVSGSTPAGATVYTNVATESGLRTAFGDATATQIDLSADITLVTCPNGAVIRSSATAVVVDGHGHTVTQTCATGTSEVFSQTLAGALTFQNLTITGGHNAALPGGGIATNTSGNVSLINSTVSGNTSPGGSGGGIFALLGTVSLTSSTVSGNTAPGQNGGGIHADSGSVSLVNSTVSGNIGGNAGGGIFAGGGASLTNSTVSDNTGKIGGGIRTAGAASLTNSTVSGNTSVGASNAAGGISASVGPVSLVYVTMVGNTAATAANMSTPTLTSFGSVVALPQGGGTNCVVVTTSNGYNWDNDGSCGFGAGPGDHSNGGNPLLGPLANNGGPTQTRLPLSGSGLIDAIPNGACQLDGASGITTDQRGFARPSPSGGACDIGAVEVQVAAPVVITPKFTG